jgi:hypothetical protein
MSQQLPELRCTDLIGTTSRDARELIMRVVGTADARHTSELAAYVGEVQQVALDDKTERVVVDFRDLEFMNSSCFKAFVTWLQNLLELDAARQYRIRFLSDPTKHWQGRSLKALSCFASELVEISA